MNTSGRLIKLSSSSVLGQAKEIKKKDTVGVFASNDTTTSSPNYADELISLLSRKHLRLKSWTSEQHFKQAKGSEMSSI